MSKQKKPIQYIEPPKNLESQQSIPSIEEIGENNLNPPEKPHGKFSDFRFEIGIITIIIITIILAIVSATNDTNTSDISGILDKIFGYLGGVGLPLLLALWGHWKQQQEKKARVLNNVYNKFQLVYDKIHRLFEDTPINKLEIAVVWDGISYEIIETFHPNNFNERMNRFFAGQIKFNTSNAGIKIRNSCEDKYKILNLLSEIQGLMENIVISYNK